MTFHSQIFSLPTYFTNVVTDTHFGGRPPPVDRDRMGRSLTFLAVMPAVPVPRAICAGTNTAVVIEDNGDSAVYGSGKAYFINTYAPAGGEVLPGHRLTYLYYKVFRIGDHGAFNVATWTFIPTEYVWGNVEYDLYAENGVVLRVDGETAALGIY